MAHIVEQTYKVNRLLLGTEEVSRRVAFLGNWQRIRIAVRGSIVTTATGQFSGGAVLGMYMSGGIGGGYMADRSQGYIGVGTGTNFPSTATIGNTGGNRYVSWAGASILRKLNTTFTSTNTASTALFFSGATAIKSAFIVDILKTSTTWTVAFQMPSSSANALTDLTYSTYLYNTARTDAAPTGYASVSSSSISVPASSFYSKLIDTVSFAWTSSNVRFQLQNITVAKIL